MNPEHPGPNTVGPTPDRYRAMERERLRRDAAIAFGAALAHQVVRPQNAAEVEEVAEQAVLLADALVTRLEK